MTDFQKFADALNKRIVSMSKGELFVVGDALDRDSIWLTYLDSFPAGTNPMFRERTEHDCSTCRQFVKNWGSVVEIVEGKVRTVWFDVTNPITSFYYEVASTMDEYVRSLPLTGLFRSSERSYGAKVSHSLVDGRAETWHHFYGSVADKHFSRQVATDRGDFNASVQVLTRGLEETSSSAIETVVDLIDSNSLYRGEEHLPALVAFRSMFNKYTQLIVDDKTAFIYANARTTAARFRNTVIGTLVQDLSNGVDLEVAVRSFESKVAPTNYKRPKALITPAMVKSAMQTINDLGIERSLERRFARLSDVSVNNVLWVNNDTAPLMKDGIADILMQAATQNVKALSKDAKPEEVSIVQFMKDILPGTSNVELLIRNSNINNFVSITTGVHSDAPPLFKWDNSFAWSYGGNVADSIKEKVKRAGGSVTGKLRVSLSWFNYDDLDIHVYEPNGNHIWYGSKQGKLDVDMNAGGRSSREPVENVSWASRIPDGDYLVDVNQYSQRETSNVGFVIETESNGSIENYSYDKRVQGTVSVGTMTVKDGIITSFKPAKDIVGGSASKEMWGLKTEQFVPVQTVMYSPNHWDSQSVGNKHWFFILKDCINDEPVRGLYNEFLRADLDKHRKVFEVLASKTLCEPTNDQLSGIGFSSTGGNSVVAKLTTGAGRTRLVSVGF